MYHLLKLEWLKQKDYTLFRILAIAYFAMLPALLFMGKSFDVDKSAPFNPQTLFFHFPTIWAWLGYIGNWVVFFVLGFMAVLMATNEFSNKTLRQNIIAGLKREEFFKSKLVFLAFVATAATLYYTACVLVIGLLHSMDDTIYFSTVFKNLDMVPRYWLMTMGYMSFGLLIGLLTKKTGIALFLYLAYAMVIEVAFRWLVHLWVLKIDNISMSFYPLNAMEDLAPIPIADFFADLFNQHGFRVLLSPLEASLATIVYTSVFLFWSYKRLKNSDL